MTEAQLTTAVLDLAATLGYLCYHPRTSQRKDAWLTAAQGNGAKGFPDLVCVGNNRVIFAELKCGYNKPSNEQITWARQITGNGGECFLWTDKDWTDGTIERTLRLGKAAA